MGIYLVVDGADVRVLAVDLAGHECNPLLLRQDAPVGSRRGRSHREGRNGNGWGGNCFPDLRELDNSRIQLPELVVGIFVYNKVLPPHRGVFGVFPRTILLSPPQQLVPGALPAVAINFPVYIIGSWVSKAGRVISLVLRTRILQVRNKMVEVVRK